jgi:hypothetical protein
MITISYTIHETGFIKIEEDEEFEDVFKQYGNNLRDFAKGQVVNKTNYQNTDNIRIHVKQTE